MNFLSLFKGAEASNSLAIKGLFQFQLKCETFVETDVITTYTKILTDTIERTHGLSEKHEKYLWDSCVRTQSSEGLISMIAHAMAKKDDLFLVFKEGAEVLRKATQEEEQKIREDYKTSAESKNGVWITFKDYRRSDILIIYSTFEYYVLSALNKALNIAKALQFKIKNLRGSVSLVDSATATTQGSELARALAAGDDIMIDGEDEIGTTTPDVSAAEKAIAFLDGKRAFYLNYPLSYISGQQTTGIGSTGEADMRAVERGHKQYFVSIVRPVFKAVFGAEVEFKSQDFRNLSSGIEALKTFDLAEGTRFLSRESMMRILCKLFDINFDKEKIAIAKEEKEDAAAGDQNVNQNPPDKTPPIPQGSKNEPPPARGQT